MRSSVLFSRREAIATLGGQCVFCKSNFRSRLQAARLLRTADSNISRWRCRRPRSQ